MFLPQVNSSVAEADAGEHTSQVHAGACLQVLGVAHGSEITPPSHTCTVSLRVTFKRSYRFMNLATTWRAWRDHTSLMGLLPW